MLNPPRVPSDSDRARRAAVFGLCAAFLSNAGQTFFIGLFGNAMRSEVGLSEAGFGVLYGSATLASGLLMFWLGALADRLRPAPAISGALLVLGVGALLVASVRNSAWLLAGLLLLRLGGQGLTGHIGIVTAVRHAGTRRGRSVATAVFGFIIGEALLPFGVAALLSLLDWRSLWIGVGGFVLVLALPLMRLLAAPLNGPTLAPHAYPDASSGTPRDPAAAATAGKAAHVDIVHRRELLRDRRFLGIVAVALVPPFIATAVFLHQGTLADIKGWLPAQVATAFLGYAVGQALSTWASGWLVDRIGSFGLLRGYLLPLALGMLGLGFLDGFVGLMLLFCGLGVTSGSNAVVAGAVWAEVFGTRRLGLIRGVYASVMVLATAVSPALLGLALGADLSLPAIALTVAVYAACVPPLIASRLVRASRA